LHDERVQILETLLGIGVPVVAARTTPADMLADLAKTAALSDQGNAPLLGRKRDIDKLHMPTM
jgi:hypothetical protein